jgi:GNAT superfamily N-acetyltransferase
LTHQGAVPSIGYKPLNKAACQSQFKCGATSIDKYFAREAWKQHTGGVHRVTYGHLEGSTAPAAFFSLACVTEEISKLKGPYHPFGGADRFPCLQLVWLGVHKALQGQKIGSLMVGKVVEIFANVGAQIGLPHLVLVPISEDVKPFYLSLGFREYDDGKRMFLPLQSAIEVFPQK